MLVFLSHFKLQKLWAQYMISALLKLEKALKLYNKIPEWEENPHSHLSLQYIVVIIVLFYY